MKSRKQDDYFEFFKAGLRTMSNLTRKRPTESKTILILLLKKICDLCNTRRGRKP